MVTYCHVQMVSAVLVLLKKKRKKVYASLAEFTFCTEIECVFLRFVSNDL
jgi:hypothetical protein